MENQNQITALDWIRELAGERMLSRAADESPIAAGQHPDDDTLNAFVEGKLGESESSPLITHLLECGVCRNATVQLFRLALEFEEAELPQPAAHPEPSLLRRFVEAIASRVAPPSAEDSVYAYHGGEEGGDSAVTPDEDGSEEVSDNNLD